MRRGGRGPLGRPEEDPALERIVHDRKPGEIETGMMSGSDEGEISATERFEGEMSPEEALRALAVEWSAAEEAAEAEERAEAALRGEAGPEGGPPARDLSPFERRG